MRIPPNVPPVTVGRVSRRIAYWVAALTVVVAAIAVAVLAGGEEERSSAAPLPATTATAAEPPATSAQTAPPERVLVLVRRRGGLPESWVRRLRRSSAVEALAEVSRTQWLLRRSTAGGRVVDAPPEGYAIPLDTYVVDPRAYARVTGDAAFGNLRARPRAALRCVRAAARPHRRRPHDAHRRADRRRVRRSSRTGITRGAELVAAAADVPRAQRRATAVVVATTDPAAVDDAVPEDPLTRVALLDTRPDSAGRGQHHAPVELKARFGEFAVRLPYGVGLDRHRPGAGCAATIVTRSVPILGQVTCHRAMIAPLRRALGSLQRRGLARLVDPGDYEGCYAPRRIPDSGSLSLHAWGLAVDINASENPQGASRSRTRASCAPSSARASRGAAAGPPRPTACTSSCTATADAGPLKALSQRVESGFRLGLAEASNTRGAGASRAAAVTERDAEHLAHAGCRAEVRHVRGTVAEDDARRGHEASGGQLLAGAVRLDADERAGARAGSSDVVENSTT